MHYLIDGYNLLHAMGLLCGPVGPHGLEKARLALLGRLHGCHGPDATCVTVVFDASRPPPGAVPEEHYQGIHVLYAVGREADDVIEEFIRRDSAPRHLTVVSDDHRVRQAARRRQCPVLGCLDYLEQAGRGRQKAATEEAPAKPDGVSREELQRWLEEFGHLDRDPRYRDVLGPPVPGDDGRGRPTPRPGNP